MNLWTWTIDALEGHDKLAGWAQTLGAFIAMGVAIWLASSQSRAAAKERRMVRLERADSIQRLLSYLSASAQSVYESHFSGDGRRLRMQEVDEFMILADSFRRIPVELACNGDEVRSLVEGRRTIDRLTESLARARSMALHPAELESVNGHICELSILAGQLGRQAPTAKLRRLPWRKPEPVMQVSFDD